VGRKGSAGEINFSEKKFWPLDVTYFVTFDEQKYDLTFLFHCLQSCQLTKLAKGVKPGINRNDVYALEFSFPSLPEQERIVAILDEAFTGIDAAIANTEKNLANAHELFESYINNVFTQKGEGWVDRKLEEVCQIKPPKKEARLRLDDTDLVSFVPMNDLGICQKEFPTPTNKPLLDVSGSYTYFADDDVLLAKITPCFENGKLGIARNLTNGIGFGSSEFVVLRSKGDINSEFLFYFLSQNSFRVNGSRVMTGAVGHKRVPKEYIEQHLIPLPNHSEQQNIVKNFDLLKKDIDSLEVTYQKKLDALAELKQSLLQKAFSGELTEQDAAA
jgi:type I restriction enzyme S subunit